MANDQTRRNFLRTVPVAAAVDFTLTDQLDVRRSCARRPARLGRQSGERAVSILPGEGVGCRRKALQEKPGNNNLFESKTLPLQVVMTTETAKSAKEFEWHEGRDHIVQILDGSTLYEVGGTPKGGHQTKPGEWLAPGADGSKSILMGKGDMLVIPRGTLHKRSTEDSVTFLLISTPGVVQG